MSIPAKKTKHLGASALVLTVLWLPAFAAGGCNTLNSTQTKLARRLDDLAQQQAKRDKRLETLNNRIFLLEDKVDTSRVAILRRRRAPTVRLPVVRIRPQATDSPRPVAASDPLPRRRTKVLSHTPRELPRVRVQSRGSGRSLVSAVDVEYEGAAAQTHGPRPVLRLRGGPVARAGGIDPSTVKEKLPVVPVAKRKIARAMAKSPLPVLPTRRKSAAGATAAMRAYTAALTTFRKGRYSAAASAFRAFVARYTKHAYSDNALYWLGECFYDLKNYHLALKMVRRVVERYPNGNKAPAALLKMGFSYSKLKERKNARTVLAQVVQIFPRSGVAKLATHELAKLQ